ncbi:hypothetical protein CEXT_311041 [Caerostris extrusa]|uniref:Uncharacterized protein n=1 Tax=Caerostris extrusa TaxID=172846 RepID=A0AAV4RAK4_CAEEX|nr:hypothetical protein CEXT_311041 [Caerostris extrusa]
MTLGYREGEETDEPTCRKSDNEAEQPVNREIAEFDHLNFEEYTSPCRDVDHLLSEGVHKSQQKMNHIFVD